MKMTLEKFGKPGGFQSLHASCDIPGSDDRRLTVAMTMPEAGKLTVDELFDQMRENVKRNTK